MGMIGDFIKALKDKETRDMIAAQASALAASLKDKQTRDMITASLKGKFEKAMMGKGAQAAYHELNAQVTEQLLKQLLNDDAPKFKITVPATMNRDDARKALNLIVKDLDMPMTFEITWEAASGPSPGSAPPRNEP